MKHSLKYFVTGSSGVPNIPEFMGVLVFNGIQAGYCDSNNMTLKPKQDWAKKILQTNPEQKEWYDHMCFKKQPNFFKNMISHLKQFTKSEGEPLIILNHGIYLNKTDWCEKLHFTFCAPKRTNFQFRVCLEKLYFNTFSAFYSCCYNQDICHMTDAINRFLCFFPSFIVFLWSCDLHIRPAFKSFSVPVSSC